MGQKFGGFDFTRSRWRRGGYEVISRGKVLPPGGWTRSVFRATMQQRMPVLDLSSIFYSTFLLVVCPMHCIAALDRI